MPKIVRLTLMKIADDEIVQQAIQKYSKLIQDAKKVCARCIARFFLQRSVRCLLHTRSTNTYSGNNMQVPLLMVGCTLRISSPRRQPLALRKPLYRVDSL